MTKRIMMRASAMLAIMVAIFGLVSGTVSAAQITNRKVVIGTSLASTSTTYDFTFTVPTSGTPIRSIAFEACASLSSCSAPSGFSVAAATLTSQPTGLGAASGWSVNTATPGSLRVSHGSNSTNPSGSQAVSFSGVVNPSAANATYFFKITTYSDASWTTPIDTGNVATSTAGQAVVTAVVDETLTFTMSGTTVNLGTLSTSTTGTGTSTMTAATNATSGYSVTVNGQTLQSSLGTPIPAITTVGGGNSTVNSSQFGINLMANATPSVGSAQSGTGTASPSTGYNTADKFRFTSGEPVIQSGGPTNSNTFTVSYIANINSLIPAGAYSTTLTYVATSNF